MVLRDPVKELRVAYLVSCYPAVSHTFVLREVSALRRRGIAVDVASINRSDVSENRRTREETEEVQRTFYVKQAGMAAMGWAVVKTMLTRPKALAGGVLKALSLGGFDVKRQLWCMAYLFEALLVGQWMRRQNCQHLHVHFANAAGSVGVLTSTIFPVTMSMTVHGPDVFDDVTHNHIRDKIEQCRFVCCISHFARSQLMKCSPIDQWSKFEVLPLGVDVETFAPPQNNTKERSPFEILCVGRLTSVKGQALLIKATKQLVEGGRNVVLRLVGDGAERSALETQALTLGVASHVSFEGAVNQDRIRAYYEGTDLFVLASFAEGVPVVLMEAMAMGIPCVSTYVAGIPELIRPGVDGVLVSPSDTEAVVGVISEMMDDPDKRRRLGMAGRARVEEKYNLEENVKGLAEVFCCRLQSSETV